MSFPDDFAWGAATAAYQIEGAYATDGKGLSIWDHFCLGPGNILDQSTGNTGCNHYTHYREDVRLMQEIGLNAYRLSISWPRVIPRGTGHTNGHGLDFYDRLIDELLGAGITPWVTLYHWDLPLALHYEGGWLNPNIPDWFADYTELIVQRLSDRVSHWMTFNEPSIFVSLGYRTGVHAPGFKMPFADILKIWRNVLLANGKAIKTIRALAETSPLIGMAPAAKVTIPATDTPEDIAAAKQIMFDYPPDKVGNLTWWLDPVILGKSDAMAEAYGDSLPEITDQDWNTIHSKLDFFGANTYFGRIVKAGPDGQPEVLPYPMGQPTNAVNWPLTPEALYWGPKFMYERYDLPVVITENGVALNEWMAEDGKIHDTLRADFTSRYLKQLKRAVNDGIPVNGYFHWTLMDNFEWSMGARARFGLIHTDFTTEKRTLKESAKWYAGIIANNGDSL